MYDISKSLIHTLKQKPRLGQSADDLNRNAQSLLDAISNAFTGTQTLQAGIGAVVGINERFGRTLQEIAKNATFLEQRYSNLNKTFGLSSKSAAGFGSQLELTSKQLNIGVESAIKYSQNLNKLAAGFIASNKSIDGFRKKLFESQKIMITQLKVSEAAAEGYERYASVIAESGKMQLDSQLKYAAAIEQSSDLTGVHRDLTEELGKMASDLQLQYGRIPGTLELAVLKSRALGMSMADLNKAGQQLLNIESSIGDELEYQLLSGRRLVDEVSGESLTNAYREATLMGDANKQAEIMNQLLEQEGETLENNMLARQQMAKLLGMDATQLAKSIQQKKILDRLEAESGKSLMDLSADALIAQAKALGATADELDILETRTTDELMLEQLKSLNSNIVSGITGTAAGGAIGIVGKTRDELTGMLDPMEKFTSYLSHESVAQFFGYIQHAGTVYTANRSLLDDLIKVIPYGARLISTISAIIDKVPVVSELLNAPGQAAMIGKWNGLTPVNDGVIQFNPADKFMRVNDSTMIAGTNVNGNQALANAITQNTGGGMSDQQISKLATSIAMAMKNVTLTVEAPLGSATGMNGGTWS
jgi:hypothetical protein